MPRIRTIKPSFFTSEDSGMWSDSTKVVFMGLIVMASDNGIGSANVRLLGSQILPYEDTHEALMKIREALTEAATTGSVVLFCRGGRDMYWLSGWSDHQYVQNPSKGLPPLPTDEECEAYEAAHRSPFEDATSDDAPPVLTLMKPHEHSGGPHEDSALERKGREGKGREGKTPSTPAAPVPATTSPQSSLALDIPPAPAPDPVPPVDTFEDFWFACPRKVGKGDAAKAFAKAVARGASPNQIIEQMNAMAKYWQESRTEPRYIPHPGTWLNQGRYDDPVPAPASSAPQSARAQRLEHSMSIVERFAAAEAEQSGQLGMPGRRAIEQ